MELLRLFEDIRTPFLDAFFSLITNFGAETIFVIVCFALLWCVNKRDGYYLLAVSFFGLLINQFLKITFRIPRPWVRDEAFTIVESAREGAVGYSFPSGHSQIAVGTFGTIARTTKNITIKILSLLICVLVPLSRMYLGVHTFADVSVSAIIAVILIYSLRPMVSRAMTRKHGMRRLFAFMSVLSFLYLIYMEFYRFPANVDSQNLYSGIDFSYKMFGLVLGAWAGFEIDRKYVRFDTRAIWWAQILKVFLGLTVVLIIKEGLKEPLEILCHSDRLSGTIRYMLIALFACGVWPAVFNSCKKFINKTDTL